MRLSLYYYVTTDFITRCIMYLPIIWHFSSTSNFGESLNVFKTQLLLFAGVNWLVFLFCRSISLFLFNININILFCFRKPLILNKYMKCKSTRGGFAKNFFIRIIPLQSTNTLLRYYDDIIALLRYTNIFVHLRSERYLKGTL